MLESPLCFPSSHRDQCEAKEGSLELVRPWQAISGILEGGGKDLRQPQTCKPVGRGVGWSHLIQPLNQGVGGGCPDGAQQNQNLVEGVLTGTQDLISPSSCPYVSQ